ncbi:unnamed protein product [Meloidogyne enterolobii]|uniref:Uncharacterized protein n=1 Tax=Meloidogyne enterolobii TaxID=390850 RepID=A0ACB0YYU0_MELEN
MNCMVYIKNKNKWKEIDYACCYSNCINTNNPIGSCIKGNGFVNIINDENIKYLMKNDGYDNFVRVCAKNPFKNPRNYFNYSLYYFEIKCIFEDELDTYGKWMHIGLENCNTNKRIRFTAEIATVYVENYEDFEIKDISWNDNDIFGCGLVYPPTNMSNEFPYVFFTQNGKQIGKGILLKDNFDSCKPFVALRRCSIEANYGNNLETKPFNYDITKHLILKEFY